MPKRTNNKPKLKIKAKQKKVRTYSLPEDSSEFYIADETATYGKQQLFKHYYKNEEPYIRLLKGDCVEILNKARENSVDMIFADPPYFLSNGGITCHAGKMVSVNKGKWDKSKGAKENHEFTKKWLEACQKVLKPNGTIWVSGTTHIIYAVGFAMQELGYKILNDIIWYKRNAPPNLSCRYFTHSTEIVLWAAKNEKSKHYFDYPLMKEINKGKQMRNLWQFPDEEKIKQSDVSRLKDFPSIPGEKHFKKYIQQRPRALLERIILASTKKGDLILNTLCTSSSFAIAAASLNRKYIGIILKHIKL